MPGSSRVPAGGRTFLYVWIGQVISNVGSATAGFALGVWVFEQSRSTQDLSLVFFCASAPIVLASPFAGVLADRYSRRRIMLVSELGALFVPSAVLLLLSAGALRTSTVLPLVLAGSALTALRGPAFLSSVPVLVAKEQLGRANGLIAMSNATAQIVGPLVGGALLPAVGLTPLMLAYAATCVLASVPLFVLSIPQPAPADEARRAPTMHDVAAGLRYLRDRPGLFVSVWAVAAMNFAFSSAEVLVVPIVLGFSSTQALGIVFACAGGAHLAGGIVMAAWGGPIRRVPLIVIGVAIVGIGLAIAGWRPVHGLVVAGIGLAALSEPLVVACAHVVRQTKVELAWQGRVFGVASAIEMGAAPIGYLACGPLVEHVFEPMAAGSGPGRAAALLLVVLGVLASLAVVAALAYRPFRRLDTDLADRADTA